MTSDRTKKKKNVRSDIRKRDLALSKKEKSLERIAENQKKESERLEEQRVFQNQRDDDFLDKKTGQTSKLYNEMGWSLSFFGGTKLFMQMNDFIVLDCDVWGVNQKKDKLK